MMRIAVPAVLFLMGLCADQGLPAQEVARDVLFVIPHTHWEGAVFKTREEYLEKGLPYILRAMRLLKAHPNYRFVLDQVCYVKPFLERYPEEEAALRRFVDEGRLAIAGGMDVMPDVNMPGGESFVRQVLYGKGYFRRKLGVEVTAAWQLDTFGHHAQMPQLLKLAGYKSLWFARGVADPKTPSEFLWEGIDGSRIAAFWPSPTYSSAYGSPKELPAFTEFMKSRFDGMAPYSRGRGRVALDGGDVTPPEEHVAALAEQFNRQANMPFELRLAVPADFEALVAQRPNRPVIGGDRNPIFQGTYSSRIELKQRTRELERLLTTAEKLGVLLAWLGTPADDDVLWRAWEPMLFNQAHDLMCGVMTDRVYDDTVRGYEFSERIAGDEVRARLEGLSAAIDTRGEGTAIAVFNMLGWPRTDIAIASVGFSESDVMDVGLIGPDGQAAPVQLVDSERNPVGGLLRAEIAFVARDIPAMGHAVYRLIPRKLPSPGTDRRLVGRGTGGEAGEGSGPVSIENEHYRIEFDPAGGAMTRLSVKAGNWEALRGPGNVVAREEDQGDLWVLYRTLTELYRTKDDRTHIIRHDQHPAPQPGGAVFSSAGAGPPGTVSRGPVFSEFKVSRPFGVKGSVATSVRVYAGLRRIDVCTRLVNDEKMVRYRLLFPTSIQDGRCVHEIPFGAVERPAGTEFPAQNWIDYGNGEHGVALLNRGLPGNNVADGTMMLSLLRSTLLGRDYGDPPPVGPESSLELGNEVMFHYALVPHAGDWRKACVYRDGWEFNHPLVARALALHPGTLPGRWGLLEVTPPNVVVSALKPGADGTAVLRVYEAAGQRATAAQIRFSAPVLAAEEVNLMEDPGRKLAPADNTLVLDLHPFEIKTVKFRLQPRKDGQK